MRTFEIVLIATALVSGAAGCGKGKADADPGTTNPMASSMQSGTPAALNPPPAVTEAPKPAPPHVEIEIASVGNSMTFDKTALSVPTGAEVHLVLKNHATASTLPHNWNLVKPGTEASVALAGLKYGEPAGYFDVSDHDSLAHTPMAKPGESSEVTFTAPDPGKYPYICTVPGHYMMMKGVLTVTP
jgi:azurin